MSGESWWDVGWGHALKCSLSEVKREESSVRRRFRLLSVVAGGVITILNGATPAQAQLNTQHIKGGVGLKSGSQPPPHVYVIAPFVYIYGTDTVKDSNGEQLPINA